MLYLESPPQVTSLSTKFMHERDGVPQLDKYQFLPGKIEFRRADLAFQFIDMGYKIAISV